MAADMAEELKGSGVTVVSLWPGSVKTETAQILVPSGKIAKVMKKTQVGETVADSALSRRK